MRCIGRECPFYHESDIFEVCRSFGRYITNTETACDIEDFHKAKIKYTNQINNLIDKRNQLDCVLNLVRSKQ